MTAGPRGGRSVAGLLEVVDQFGGNSASVEIPQINAAEGPLPMLSMSEAVSVQACYWCDFEL